LLALLERAVDVVEVEAHVAAEPDVWDRTGARGFPHPSHWHAESLSDYVGIH